jgi:FKBP-type peptidyl-prolyl cis-trans isomerase FkpA
MRKFTAQRGLVWVIMLLAGAILPGLRVRADNVPSSSAPGTSTEIQMPPSATATAPFPLEAFSAVGSDFAKANHISDMGWSEAQISAFIDGIRAAIHGTPVAFSDTARKLSDQMGKRMTEIEARANADQFATPQRLDEYMKDICKRLNLSMTDSGMGYGIDSGGTGMRPGPDDTVVVTCIGMAPDAKTVLPQLSSQKVRVKVSESLPGFVEGLQMMTVGGKAIFVMPPALTFGSGKWPEGVEPGSPLIFRVSLDDVAGADKPQ